MKRLGILLALVLCAAIVSNDAHAQRNRRAQKRISNYSGGSVRFNKGKQFTSVSFGLAALNYFGDLAPLSRSASTNIGNTRPGVEIGVSHKFGPFYSLRGSLAWGRLKGSDEAADPFNEISLARYARNLSFRNDIVEFALTAQVDLIQNPAGAYSRPLITPYVFGGIAVFYHNPKALAPEFDQAGNAIPEANTWVALQPLGTEGQFSAEYNVEPYSLVQISLPIGIGARLRLNEAFDIGIELGYRYLFTDYIDDVSGLYVDLGTLNSPVARALSDRSREASFIETGAARNFDLINARYNLSTYQSAGDGQTYEVFNGFGRFRDASEVDNGNVRGNADDNDIYFVSVIKLSYILGPGGFGGRRGKYR